jgi:hypothetical protein
MPSKCFQWRGRLANTYPVGDIPGSPAFMENSKAFVFMTSFARKSSRSRLGCIKKFNKEWRYEIRSGVHNTIDRKADERWKSVNK